MTNIIRWKRQGDEWRGSLASFHVLTIKEGTGDKSMQYCISTELKIFRSSWHPMLSAAKYSGESTIEKMLSGFRRDPGEWDALKPSVRDLWPVIDED